MSDPLETTKQSQDIHEADTADREAIHTDSMTEINKLQDAFAIHCKLNAKTDKKINSVKKSQTAMKKLMVEWTPYITEGMDRSKAYKLVATDLKNKSKGFKWWGGLMVILFTCISGLYLLFEKIHLIK